MLKEVIFTVQLLPPKWEQALCSMWMIRFILCTQTAEVLETGSLALLKSHRYVFLQLGCCVSLTEETYYQKSFKLVKHLTAN